MTSNNLEDEAPDVMGEMLDGAMQWERDDDARLIRYADGATRPYGVEENFAADKRAMRKDLNAILVELQGYADKAQQIIDTPNATINANPAGYIKDLARGLKRTLGSVRDLTRLMK